MFPFIYFFFGIQGWKESENRNQRDGVSFLILGKKGEDGGFSDPIERISAQAAAPL